MLKYNHILILTFLFYFIYIILFLKITNREEIENFMLPDTNYMKFDNEYMKQIYNLKKIDLDSSNKKITKCENDNCESVYYDNRMNSKKSHIIAYNKHISSKIFDKYDVPVPKFMYFNRKQFPDFSDFKQFLNDRNLGFPLVIKPTDASFGKGVSLDVQSYDDAYNKCNEILNGSKTKGIMIEEQVYGENYRILVYKDKIVSIVKREYPHIEGDGNNDINKLIEIKNEELEKENMKPMVSLNEYFIEKQGYKLNDVPMKKAKVYVSNICNYKNGGKVHYVDINELHPDNIKMFRLLNSIVGSKLIGVDYMTNNISESYKNGNGYINEVNSRPGITIHEIAERNFITQPFGGKLIDTIFKEESRKVL